MASQQHEPIGILPSFHHHHTHSYSNHRRLASGAPPPTIESARSSPIPPFSAAARLSALGTPSSATTTGASSLLYGGGGGGGGGGHGAMHVGMGTVRAAAARRMRSDISEDEKQEIRMAFELFDTRKSGKLCYREVKVAMRALDFDMKKAEVKRLMEEHSRGDAEEVDLDEFMEIMTAKYKEKDPDEEISKAFRCFDEDGTGKISLKNLRKIARDVGEHITDEELGAMIDEFDKDGDGEISESEFFGIMKKDDLDD